MRGMSQNLEHRKAVESRREVLVASVSSAWKDGCEDSVRSWGDKASVS